MTALATHSLSVALAGRTVLRDIDFAAEGGALIAVLGPNGAGKSTLLRALAGLHKSECVWLDNQPLHLIDAGARARQIAWLPQGGQAHWPLPVRSVVALGRMPHGVTLDSLTARDDAAIAKAIAACDLEGLSARDVTTLSGGERARALLARALAVEAPVLLVDEPVAALDPRHQLQVMETLRGSSRRGQLVIAVLHDLALAARFADRILLLADGHVAADGAPGAVLTEAHLRHVFGIEALTFTHDGIPVMLPLSATKG